MRIDPNHEQIFPANSRDIAGASHQSDVAAVGITGESGSSDASGKAASELAISRLVEQLREIPDVRHDVVAQAREKLATGEYLTDQAAKDTAAKILNLGSVE